MNDIRLHRGLMYSRNTRLPAFGVRGRIRLAGVSRSVARQAQSVATVVHATAASTEKSEISV